ncbi:MAG: hypothetical protein R2851_16125 [Caldilineaceae bacterium]
MSTNTHRPTLDEFLVAPLATVREVAPATVIVATGGTRRRAMLDGIDIRSEAYPQQTRIHMIDAIELLLAYGAQHVFVPILVDGNFNEETPDYRDHLFRWIADGIAGPTAIDDYAQRDWQVRLVGAEEDSPLWATATKLIAATVSSTARCVWFTVAPSSTHAWEFALRKIVAAQATTHAAAVKAVYGQEIPVDGALLLSFGKPQIFTSGSAAARLQASLLLAAILGISDYRRAPPASFTTMHTIAPRSSGSTNRHARMPYLSMQIGMLDRRFLVKVSGLVRSGSPSRGQDRETRHT